RQRRDSWREVLAIYTNGELASLGQRAIGAELRLRLAESVRSGRQDPILPIPPAASTLRNPRRRTSQWPSVLAPYDFVNPLRVLVIENDPSERAETLSQCAGPLWTGASRFAMKIPGTGYS